MEQIPPEPRQKEQGRPQVSETAEERTANATEYGMQERPKETPLSEEKSQEDMVQDEVLDKTQQGNNETAATSPSDGDVTEDPTTEEEKAKEESCITLESSADDSSSQEVIEASTGSEEVSAAASSEEVSAAAGSEEVSAAAGSEEVSAAAGSEEVSAAAGSEEVSAAAGSEEVSAAAGSEEVSAAVGSEEVSAAAGSEEVSVAAGREEVSAVASSEEVSAAAGVDDNSKDQQTQPSDKDNANEIDNSKSAISSEKDDVSRPPGKETTRDKEQQDRKPEAPRSRTVPKSHGRATRKDIAEKFGGVATSGVRVQRSTSSGAGTVKNMLLEWCRAKTKGREGVDIQNFSSSWSSGLAFCALILAFFPDAFDYDSLEAKNRRQNFQLAFNAAEKFADCPPLLDVEDMVRMKVPDSKCVYTYVQELYRSLVSKGLVKTKKA